MISVPRTASKRYEAKALLTLCSEKEGKRRKIKENGCSGGLVRSSAVRTVRKGL